MKRVISALLIVVIAFCPSALFVYAENSRFTATDNNFSGSAEYVTREQAIACFIKAVGIERFKTDESILNRFTDSKKVSFAYREEMAAAVYSGLISGYEDRTLRPQESIVRIEALVILARALSRDELTNWSSVEFSDTPDWAKKQIDRLASAGIVKGYGDGTLGARDFLTIEQVNTLCERITRLTGPAGDFYNYVNSAWLDAVHVDENTPARSASDDLAKNVATDIENVIFALYRRHYNDGEVFDKDSVEKKIINVYSAAADMGHRDKVGTEPVKDILDSIDKVRSLDDFIKVAAELEKMGFPNMISVKADINIYNTSKYIPSVAGGYIGVDTTLPLDEDYIENYQRYAEKLFSLAGEKNAAELAQKAAEVNSALALAAASRNELEQAVTVVSLNDAGKIFKNISIKKYLSYLGFNKAKEMMLYDKDFLSAADSLFTTNNLESLKAYLKAAVLDMSAAYLTTDMFCALQEYENSLYGGDLNHIPSDYATEITQSLLGWELGSLYVDMYFSESVRQNVTEITQKIIDEYEKLIRGSVTMSPSLSEYAIKKLRSLKINIAYPDDMEAYFSDVYFPSIEEGGNLLEHKIQYNLAYSEYSATLIQKDKNVTSAWTAYPQMVNAMYNPVSNSITVPAGMLKSPYYEAGATFEENLGGIGTVIAHEISHAFDPTGLQFDENGNFSNKWTLADMGAFEVIYKQVADEYDGLKTTGGVVNGELTKNENIADIYAMQCILSLAKTEGLDLGKVFTSYAKIWRTKTTEEYAKDMLKIDVHSPGKIRVNRVLANFDEFLDFYGVIEGDGMYIPEDRRIRVWN